MYTKDGARNGQKELINSNNNRWYGTEANTFWVQYYGNAGREGGMRKWHNVKTCLPVGKCENVGVIGLGDWV